VPVTRGYVRVASGSRPRCHAGTSAPGAWDRDGDLEQRPASSRRIDVVCQSRKSYSTSTSTRPLTISRLQQAARAV